MPEGSRRSEPKGATFRIKYAFILLTALGTLGGSIYLGNKGIRTFDTSVDYCPVSGGYADSAMNVFVGTRAGKIESGLQTNIIPPEFLFPSFELSICRINGVDYLNNKFGKALELKITATGYLLAINNQPVLSFDETGNPKFSDDLDILKLKDLIATKGTFIVAQPEPKVMTPTELKRAQALANIALFGDILLLSCGVVLGIATVKLIKSNQSLKEELSEATGSANNSSKSVNETNNKLKIARQENASLARDNEGLRAAYKRLEAKYNEIVRNKNQGNYHQEDN